jgi:hypothetical protein
MKRILVIFCLIVAASLIGHAQMRPDKLPPLIGPPTVDARTTVVVVGGGVAAGGTTATSACIQIESGSSGNIEVIVYKESDRSLLAKTGNIDTGTSGARCADLNTTVSSTVGNVFLAYRETGDSGYPRVRTTSGTNDLVYEGSHTSTPDPLPSRTERYQNNMSSIAMWLRDSGNNQVVGISTYDSNMYTNPSHIMWNGTSHAW